MTISREGIRLAAAAMIAAGDPFMPTDQEAAEALLTAQLADPRVQLFGDDRGFVAVAPTTGPGWREVARWGDTERAARAAGEFLRGRGVGTLLHFGESDYGCDARPLQTLHASFLWRQRKEGEGDAE